MTATRRRERKVVVLLCDLVSLTRQAEVLDLEDVARGRPAEGSMQLEHVLTFFRSVGATRAAAEIEFSLGGAQSASA